MKMINFVIAALIVTSLTNLALAKSFRATELNSAVVTEILANKNNTYVVEFRSGDQVPLNFEAKGDLFDSTANINNIINIKKDFFIKVRNEEVSLSLNSIDYFPLREMISGNFSLGSDIDQSQIPGLINVILAVYLK